MGWRAYLPAGLSCAPNDDDRVVVIVFAVLYSRGVWGSRAGSRGWSVGSGEWRLQGGGLACLWGFHAPQTTMTAPSSSFLLSFTAGVCGDGERGSWGWSVVSGDGGVGDLLLQASHGMNRNRADRSKAAEH
jgi:hypothetical protein